MILAIPPRMRQALRGVRHGFSFGVLSSSHRGKTLLPDRSKLCLSHWSNQWLTSTRELRSRSDPLQCWQSHTRAPEDETALELTPCAMLIKAFTFHDEICHQT
jgi:hypothetical protein